MSNPLDALGPLMAGFQQRMQQIQEEAGQTELEGSAGGGMVTVVVNGKQEVLRVRISTEVAEDKDMLEDLMVAATNDAMRKAKDMMADKMKGLTGGLPIPPGLLNGLF